MRAHWFGVSSSIVVLALGLPTVVAQDSATGVPGETTGQVEIGSVQTRAAVSPAEQLAQASAIRRRSGAIAQRMTKMLDESRRDKDILRANCLNRKLTEANANTRNVEQRAQALQDANATNDEARRSHEYTVLTVLAQKLESLDREATQCLGQSVYEPGASQVITTYPANTSFTDPSTGIAVPPAPPATVSVPPPVSSTM